MRNLVEIAMSEHDAPTAAGQIAERSVAFTVLGVAVAFALVALPAPSRELRRARRGRRPRRGADRASRSAGAASRARPSSSSRSGSSCSPTLLRLSDGGSASGFAGLYFLAILWLALSGGRRELVIGLIGLALVEVDPADRDRGAAVPGRRLAADRRPGLASPTIVGFTIQKLLAETRERALEATRWSQRLESLNEVGNALATETELQPLLDLVAARLRELARRAGRRGAAPRRIDAASLRRGRGSRRAGLSRRAVPREGP